MKPPSPPQVLPRAGRSSLPRQLRIATGLAICVGGSLVLLHEGLSQLLLNPNVTNALLGGMVAALATALGTLPLVFSQPLSERTQDTLFGFGAGVMLAACSFSLIIPGLNAARELNLMGGGQAGAAFVVSLSVLLGALSLMALDRLLPHEHFIKGREGATAEKIRRTWLFVIAIALHNLPEGLAIGVAHGGANPVQASALSMGIAIQDVPEGLVVATALLAAGYRKALAVAIGAASGLVEPIGAVFGAAVVGHSAPLLPWGLGFAAGAMLFVISHEIIPESHRKGHETHATTGLMLGFVLMMSLDTALG